MKTNATIFVLILFLLSCSKNKSDDGGENEPSAFTDVTSIRVTNNAGGTPKKGDTIKIFVTIKNSGSSTITGTLSPKLSSSRFADFNDIPIASVDYKIDGNETIEVAVIAGPFIYDQEKNKHYALGRGEYFINSITVDSKDDKTFDGRVFQVAASNRVLVPVIYDSNYLKKVGYLNSLKSYLKMTFTRKVELYDNSNYTEYLGGLDEMMDIEHIFYPIVTGNVSDYPAEGGMCEKAVALGGKTLGLKGDWEGPVGTHLNNHGFDYLMAITPDSFGGVACGWINVQITGVFDFDLSINRSQILIIHETSHLLGAPHCDPLQSYVMCAGEKHRKYIDQGTYVYNRISRDKMSNRFD